MSAPRAKILVIDDEARIGRALRLILGHGDVEVEVLTSARQALDRIASGERFALVLCDLAMPEMSGVVFHERLAVVAPDLVARVVIMTGGAHTPRTAEFLAQPEIRTLEKPFPPPDELRALVQELLGRAGSPSPEAPDDPEDAHGAPTPESARAARATARQAHGLADACPSTPSRPHRPPPTGLPPTEAAP